ncbi:hypothetical protein IAD21_05499 [Abditibacteriota bacterium]|nr:hypothetical protein IAD21_05499 [Abditibacteriota bacterium]
MKIGTVHRSKYMAVYSKFLRLCMYESQGSCTHYPIPLLKMNKVGGLALLRSSVRLMGVEHIFQKRIRRFVEFWFCAKFSGYATCNLTSALNSYF